MIPSPWQRSAHVEPSSCNIMCCTTTACGVADCWGERRVALRIAGVRAHLRCCPPRCPPRCRRPHLCIIILFTCPNPNPVVVFWVLKSNQVPPPSTFVIWIDWLEQLYRGESWVLDSALKLGGVWILVWGGRVLVPNVDEGSSSILLA